MVLAASNGTIPSNVQASIHPGKLQAHSNLFLFLALSHHSCSSNRSFSCGVLFQYFGFFKRALPIAVSYSLLFRRCSIFSIVPLIPRFFLLFTHSLIVLHRFENSFQHFLFKNEESALFGFPNCPSICSIRNNLPY